jgi:TrmH family RNA methyltransferase
MITSTKNQKIKFIHSLQTSSRERRASGAFIVEGLRLVEEALQSGWIIDLVLFTSQLRERGQLILELLHKRDIFIEEVSSEVMQFASDTQTPQGLLAVVKTSVLPIEDELDFILVLDGIRDPGNMGTILRTAEAAGVQFVCVASGSVDPFSPKVIRAGMGAHFRLPIKRLDWDEIEAFVKRKGLLSYIAEVRNGHPFTQVDFTIPTALIIGGEADGVSPSARSLEHTKVFIPMPGGSESLNAAIAAGILLFEVVRQRNL